MNRLKKALCVALVLLLLVASVPAVPVADLGFGITASALNATGKCGKTATYTFDSATGKLTIEGTGKINAEAFYNNQDIKAVVIGDGITEIGADAFNGCSNLTTVDFGKTVTVIEDNAFNYCYSLTSVTIGDSVITIGNYAFCDCDNLTSVVIGNGVKTIGNYAFNTCNNLANVVIGDCVTTIGEGAFVSCNNLTSVIIPDSVLTIGGSAFWDCDNLTSVVIGNGVTIIEGDAFGYCDNLTSVTVGNSVETISWGTFINCTSLESINIPKTVTYIGGEAFRYCPSLTDVYYEGAEENWNAINIGENNTALENAEIHFAETHTHTWDVEEITKYPTCTEKGEKTISCKGAVCKKTEEIPALGHNFKDYYSDGNATCDKDGTKTATCNICWNATDTIVDEGSKDKGAHKFTYYYVIKDATCTSDALEKAVCDFCGEATHERKIVGTKLAHLYKTYISNNDATCIADGTMTAVCEMCKEAKDTKMDVGSNKTAPHIPDAYGAKCVLCGCELACIHVYSAEKLITKTPTCTTDGEKAIVCSKCNDFKPGSVEVVPATGHAWSEGVITKTATCKEKGTMRYTCNNKCGETKTEEIPVAEHNYKEVITHATCTEDGYSTFTCTMCGSHYVGNVVKAYGHMFDTYFHDEGSATCYKDGTRTAECANGCGTKNTIADPGSKTDHEMTDFTVIKAATCTEDGEEEAKCRYYYNCGYSEIVPVEALGHDESVEFEIVKEPTCTEKGEKRKVCARCPEIVATEEIPALGHNFVYGKCIRCGDYEYGCNHIWGVWVITVDATCTMTGIRERKCTRAGCGEIEKEVLPLKDHYYDVKITYPTCTKDGYSTYTCTTCNDSYVAQKLEKYGHDYEEVYEKQPTCTEDGYFEYSCTRCGDWYSETVESYGHDFDYIEDFASCTEDGYYEYYCVICGYSESGVIEAYGHTYPDQWSVIIPATCKETGVAVKVCFDCHEVIAMVVPKAGHSDFDGDSKCDTCGGTITVVEPEKPADEPEEKPCNCDCHAGGIKAFFFKLINFFAKIFDKNARVCDCGKAH